MRAYTLIAIASALLTLPLLAGEQDFEGTVSLLNGKDLARFKTAGNWVYEEDGSLALKPRKGESGWKRYDAYLWIEKPYADFVLELEFKYQPKGNSGIFIRVEDLKEPVSTGTEIQILDCHGKKGKLGHHDMGGIIRTTGPSKNACKPAGEWNRMVVICRGMKLIVALNGEQIQDYDLSKAPKKIPASGYIGIQDHGQPFWVRNIKIREL